MSTIAILSAKANGAGAVTFDRQGCKGVGTYPKTEAFNSGEAAIGTGPFKLVRYTKGDRIILERNEGFWGEKPRLAARHLPADHQRRAARRRAARRRRRPDRERADPGPPRVKSNAGVQGGARVSRTASSTCISTISTSRCRASPTPAARTRSATNACARRSPKPSIATPSWRASWAALRCRPASCCRRCCSARTRT